MTKPKMTRRKMPEDAKSKHCILFLQGCKDQHNLYKEASAYIRAKEGNHKAFGRLVKAEVMSLINRILEEKHSSSQS